VHNRQLNLAPSKYEHLCITRLSNYSSSSYVDSHIIATVSVAKDLGIYAQVGKLTQNFNVVKHHSAIEIVSFVNDNSINGHTF